MPRDFSDRAANRLQRVGHSQTGPDEKPHTSPAAAHFLVFAGGGDQCDRASVGREYGVGKAVHRPNAEAHHDVFGQPQHQGIELGVTQRRLHSIDAVLVHGVYSVQYFAPGRLPSMT